MEFGQHRPYSLVVEVHTRHRVIARGLLWLLDDPLDPAAAVELGDSQVAKVFAILLLRQDHPGAARLIAECIGAVADRPPEDVVTEQDHGPIAAYEFLRQAKRLGDSPRLVLVGIEKPVDAELLAVSQQAHELPTMR